MYPDDQTKLRVPVGDVLKVARRSGVLSKVRVIYCKHVELVHMDDGQRNKMLVSILLVGTVWRCEKGDRT